MQIHPVTHGPRKNRWCGPSALSALTGRPTDHTADALRAVTGRRQITRCHTHWLLRALPQYGLTYTSYRQYGRTRPTLAGCLKDLPRPEGRVYLIVAGNHFQVVSGRRYVCGLTGEVVSIRDKRVKRRARVSEIYVIFRAA